MSDNNTSSGGIGFFGLLTIVFIVLKLTNYIDWSWWWVLSPFWIPFSIVIILIIVAAVLGPINDRKRPKINMKSKWEQRLEEMKKRDA